MQLGPRVAVFILLLMAMPVAAYFFVFQPRAEEVSAARAEIVSKQVKLKELEAATKNIDDLGQEIDRMRDAIDLVEQKLPAQRDVEVVLRDVWRLAAENKLTAKSFHTDKVVKAASYSEQPIKMTIIGDFAGFYQFLQELEKLPRITRTPNMKLTKQKDENGLMEVEMVLSIFFEDKSNTKTASAG